MSNQLCRGYHVARDAGLLQDDAPVYVAMVMPGFTVDAEAIHPSDTDLATYEYDGANYSRHLAADITWQWSATDDEMQMDFTDDPEAFGTEVAPATSPPIGAVHILRVGGSPDDDADYIIGFEDSGSYGNGANGALGVTVPEGGFFYSGAA